MFERTHAHESPRPPIDASALESKEEPGWTAEPTHASSSTLPIHWPRGPPRCCCPSKGASFKTDGTAKRRSLRLHFRGHAPIDRMLLLLLLLGCRARWIDRARRSTARASRADGEAGTRARGCGFKAKKGHPKASLRRVSSAHIGVSEASLVRARPSVPASQRPRPTSFLPHVLRLLSLFGLFLGQNI